MTELQAAPRTGLWAEGEVLRKQHMLLLRGITNRLEGVFGEMFTRETIDHYVHASYEELSAISKVQTHLPAFTERFALARLTATTKNDGLVDDHPPRVLFVCERNDARSQMAAAIFNREAGPWAHADSAGAAPSEDLVDLAVHALYEIGIDILDAFPKPLTAEIEAAADIIITLDAHDLVDLLDDKHYESWRLESRGGDGLDDFREMRDEIRARVRTLVGTIDPDPDSSDEEVVTPELVSIDVLLAEMGNQVVTLGRRLVEALEDSNRAEFDAIVAHDDIVDRLDAQITSKVLAFLTSDEDVEDDQVEALLSTRDAALHLERIADGISDAASIAAAASVQSAPAELVALARTLADMVRHGLEEVGERPIDALEWADAAAADVVERHRRLLGELAGSNRFDRAAPQIERVARRLTHAAQHSLHLAEQVVYLSVGERLELARDAPSEE